MTEKEKAAIREYRKQGLGYKRIAKRTGISLASVKSFCRRDSFTESEPEIPKTCPNCGKLIIQPKGRPPKKFCSAQCRTIWWNSHQNLVKRKAFYMFTCPVCGRGFMAYGNAHRKYCSRDCYFKDRYGRIENTAIIPT